MLRRATALGLGVVAVAASSLAAAAPEDGPRLAVLGLGRDSARSELATLGPMGGGYERVLDAAPRSGRLDGLSTPVWSPDGSQLAFSSHHHRGRRAISLVPVGGGTAQRVPGSGGGISPVFSPDGRSLAFSRTRIEKKGRSVFPTYRSASVWIVDLASGVRRQLTRWENELWQYPSSFSPDGSTLLLTRTDYRRSADPEIVALRFDGRTSGLLVGKGFSAAYSPDGSTIAFSRDYKEQVGLDAADLYTIDADGSHLRRLTRTTGAEELFPSWDPSGQRIAYSRFTDDPPGPGYRVAIMEINADGTCPVTVLSKADLAFFAPVWKPGPANGAGRISC